MDLVKVSLQEPSEAAMNKAREILIAQAKAALQLRRGVKRLLPPPLPIGLIPRRPVEKKMPKRRQV